jgi:hypothetical protein
MLNTLNTQNIAMINLSDIQAARLADIASQIDALNASMRTAVEAGMTIELCRSSRHHDSDGCWGDIIAPSVVKVG